MAFEDMLPKHSHLESYSDHKILNPTVCPLHEKKKTVGCVG